MGRASVFGKADEFMNIEEKLNYTIEYLLRENSYCNLSNVTSQSEKWKLFRSLVNARSTLPVDSNFLRIQDE